MTQRRHYADVRPTQLYLSSEKLAAVLDWFDVADPNYDPLPVFEYDGFWYLADGHTRAFVASLADERTLRVERDDSIRNDPSFAVYRRCIDWCRDEGIETISDLHGRVISPESYERLWIDRCQRVAEVSNESDRV